MADDDTPSMGDALSRVGNFAKGLYQGPSKAGEAINVSPAPTQTGGGLQVSPPIQTQTAEQARQEAIATGAKARQEAIARGRGE